MFVGYLGNGKVYEVALEERRRPQHTTAVQRQELQVRRLAVKEGPRDEIQGACRVEIRYDEFLQQRSRIRFEEDGHAAQDGVGTRHHEALRAVDLGEQQAGGPEFAWLWCVAAVVYGDVNGNVPGASEHLLGPSVVCRDDFVPEERTR